MKKFLFKTLALSSALALALPLFAGCTKEEEVNAVSHVAIDINPSLSLSLDEDNKVLTVHASNEDAQIMLYGEELVGLELDVALEKIAQLSVDLDYVNEDNYGVNVSVSGKIGENEVLSELEAAFDKESGSLSINVSADGTFTDLRMLDWIKEKYQENAAVQALTLEEYKLIAEAQLIDATLSIEEAVNKSVDELIKIVNDGASKIKPYATSAYNGAVAIAQRTYQELKGQLLDTTWVIPYTLDYANILNRKYKVNNGLLYNMYSASARALDFSISAVEAIAKVLEETQVPAGTIDAIATALSLTEEQKAAFVSEITVDGKITLASLEAFLNKWFKNLTEDERAALKATVDTLIEDVKAFAITVDEAVADEYKAAAVKMAKDLNALVPEELKTLASAYLVNFDNMVKQIATAVEGKEPLVALNAVQEVFKNEAVRLEGVMRKELTESDLKMVEDAMAKVSGTLETYEANFNEAMAKAEADARAWLESQKNARK